MVPKAGNFTVVTDGDGERDADADGDTTHRRTGRETDGVTETPRRVGN